MTYKLWLDDQINDPSTPSRHVPEGWVGADSSEAAIKLVQMNGPPSEIDLDHDLGYGDTALVFLKWLERMTELPPTYKVHSRNPVGRDNIVSFMESWKKSREIGSGYEQDDDGTWYKIEW